MKIVMINVVCGISSTGRICTDLAMALEKQGHEVKIVYGRGIVPRQFQRIAKRIGNNADIIAHSLIARLFDKCGFGSIIATKKLIKWLDQYNPDIIHLHNIHGYYINIEILFRYLHSCNKKVIWTLHDCWAITGHCSFFDASGCNKWISGCSDCPSKKEYPASFIDKSDSNWERKKNLFQNLPNMILVTPSEWLAALVKKSFLSGNRIEIINNGINTDIFKESDTTKKRKELGLDNKVVVLGVAAIWNERKGLKDFIQLRKLLDESYSIILIGLSQQQIDALPEGIKGYRRTDSVQELAQFYAMADVFINPTYEDNYPTTNLEAIACGTPVITYNTGGSPESAKHFGYVVNKGDIIAVSDLLKHYSDKIKTQTKREKIDISTKKSVDSYVQLLIDGTDKKAQLNK